MSDGMESLLVTLLQIDSITKQTSSSKSMLSSLKGSASESLEVEIKLGDELPP